MTILSRRLVAIAIIAALAAVGGYLIYSRIGSDNRPVLRIGDQRGGLQSILSAAGQDRNLPYRIEWSSFDSAAPLLEALSANAIDVGPVGDAPFAFALAGGANIRVVHAWKPTPQSIARTMALIVRQDSALRSVRDLRGKRIATIKGSTGQDFAIALLERAGLRQSDVVWTFLGVGEAKAALASGSIDAWSIWGPFVGIAMTEGGNRMIADGSGYEGFIGYLAANGSAIDPKQAQLRDFIGRLIKARAWAAAHPSDYASAYARETNMPLPAVLYSVQSLIGGPAVVIDDELIRRQQAQLDRYQSLGIVPNSPSVSGGYDRRFNTLLKN